MLWNYAEVYRGTHFVLNCRIRKMNFMILVRTQATVGFGKKKFIYMKNFKSSKIRTLVIFILGLALCHASMKEIDPSCPWVMDNTATLCSFFETNTTSTSSLIPGQTFCIVNSQPTRLLYPLSYVLLVPIDLNWNCSFNFDTVL